MSGKQVDQRSERTEDGSQTDTKDDDDTPAPSPTQEESSPKPSVSPTLFIGNLHPKIARIHLEKLLGKFGAVERIHVVPGKGFAFCDFPSARDARAAMRQLDGRTLLGQRLAVRPANGRKRESGESMGRSAAAPGADSGAPVNIRRERQKVDDKIQQVKRKLREAAEKK